MLPGKAGAPGPSASCTRSEPTPSSVPSWPIRARAAPQRIGRDGEDGVVEQVLPIARELAPAGDLDLERRLLAAQPRDIGLAAQLQRVGIAEAHRLEVDRPVGAHQAEAAFIVVAHDVGGQFVAVDVGDGDAVGLHDQVADGEDQAVVADQGAVTLALGAQRTAPTGGPWEWSFSRRPRRTAASRDRRRQIGHAGQARFDALPAGRAMTRAVHGTVQPSGHRYTSTSLRDATPF